MAITVNEVTKVISIPQADLTFISAGIYQLDTELFRLELKNWEASTEGGWRSRTHLRAPPATVGGVTLAQTISIINGYTVTFEDGQYRVILVGSNNNILDVANINQVSIAPTNSAGLTYSKQVEDTAYGDQRVWIDVDNGLPGTTYPRGTTADPVNNLADALTIIANRNLPLRLHLRGTIPDTDTAGVNLERYDIKGVSPQLSAIDFDATCLTDGIKLVSTTFAGDLSGEINAEGASALANIVDLEGLLLNCRVGLNVSLADNGRAEFVSCSSSIPGTATPIVTFGLNSIAEFRNWSGGLDIRSMTTGCVASVDLDPGSLILGATNTGGILRLRGHGTFSNTSAVSVTSDLIDGNLFEIIVAAVAGNAEVSLDDQTVTIKDDDGNTLRTLSVSTDGRLRAII